MKKSIKAVIFDMNGVLTLGIELKMGSKNSNSFHQRIARHLGISLDTWFDAIDTPYANSIEGKVSDKKTIEVIAKNLDMSPRKLETTVIREYRLLFRRNNQLYNYAYNLKKRGYKIAILSDQWALSKKAVFSNENKKGFDAVIISCDVGLRKPNPKIYRLALKRLKAKPSQAIFVDNRDWNTKPAAKIGINTILFKNTRQAINEIEKLLK